MIFADRKAAGQRLAQLVSKYAGRDDVIVFALPRGGIPVGFEVARALGAPLDVFVVRKLGVPGHEELAMGAIASGGVVVLSRDLIDQIGVPEEWIQRVIDGERRELERRELMYREGRPLPDVRGRIVILVDDGLATGATMQAAIAALRRLGPARVVVAVPVAPVETCQALSRQADEMVCAETPEPFRAVGLWYDDFSQTTDDEVRALLNAAHEKRQEAVAP
jgi:putative phosphoribosyl transferase